MEDDYGYDQEFVAYAEQAKGGLAELVKSLLQVASQPASGLTPGHEEHLVSEADAAEHHAAELTAVLDRIERPIDRGDAFQYALSIAEAAFHIGRYSVNGDLVEARKKLGAAGGSASGKTRAEARNKWKEALVEVAKTISARSIDALASAAMKALPSSAPKPPSHGAAVECLREERRAGRLKLRD